MFTPVNSIEGKKQFATLLSMMIQDIDMEGKYTKENLQRRNKMVNELREVNKQIPLEFEEGEEVRVKLKRLIKGIISKIHSKDERSYLIKPIDSLYSEPFIVPESLLLKSTP